MDSRKIEISIHIAVWTIMFISPLMFMTHGSSVQLLQFLMMSAAPLSLMAVFYINYLWLTPVYYEKGRLSVFFITDIAVIIAVTIILHQWMDFTRDMFREVNPGRPEHEPSGKTILFFYLRDSFNITMSAVIATTVRLSMRWHESENERRQAEAARANAELKNIRSQINPHFLLNTLNNIYALTALDATKAQTAIEELSKLLRHVLYDNDREFINLADEVEFLKNYISLMKMRLTPNVEVKTTFDIPVTCKITVAPLIFMSLIENAFKHGVSPTMPCFINICIKACGKRIECTIENSNFPKPKEDGSGHGIGLKLVETRLALLYKNRYEWTNGPDETDTRYISKIIIYDSEMHSDRR